MIRLKLLRLFLPMAVLALLAALGLYWLFAGLPSVEALPTTFNTPSVRITDRQGRLLYEALPEQGGRHSVAPLSAIPLCLRQATIATEDGSFYTNPGVDLRGILRAVWINLRGGETLSGGSTITQQVARNLLLSAGERTERSLRRKLRESYLAWQLARRFSKDDVLALYLNQTYYGGMAYGVEAASQTYFAKPVTELDLAECALLAGLPQAPGAYNPFTAPEAAKSRQMVVLGLMEKAGAISAQERLLAEREPLAYASTPYPMEAPHFVNMVRAQLDRLYTPEQIAQHGGLVVRTTLDLDWQRQAEQAVTRQIEALARSDDGLGHNVNSAALVALDPANGGVLALVGSPSYTDTLHAGAINMALSPRQPGSALKPLVYAVALDPARPQPWTAATMLLDVRTSFATHEGRAYIPANYDNLEHGPVLVRQALASSLNIPAVLTLDHIGLKGLFNLASSLGITTLIDPDRYDLSLALGGGEVRLIELTAAYGAFASGGYRVEPYTIQQVTDAQGNALYTQPPPAQVRVLDARLAWLISDILSDNDARRLGFGPNSILRLDRPAAVKTGTTSNFHDNWTVGYTPDLVVGVWSGNTDYQPMRDVTGLTGAAPIWHQFMRTVLAGRPQQVFARPPGLVQVEVCALSGLLPTPSCPYRRTEWFITGTQPSLPDTIYRTVVIDAATGLPATSDTPPERRRAQTALSLPPQAQPWARSQGLFLLSDLLLANNQQPDQPANQPTAPPSLIILSPSSGAIFNLSPGMPPEAQRLHLQAAAGEAFRVVSLFLDGDVVASLSAAPYEAWIPLKVGVHQAWAGAVRPDGTQVLSATINFEVK
ncbi:MAG TPA: transglycosylase domain-containing protein [Anaerolineales bacterium]